MSALLWISLSYFGFMDGIEQEALRWRYQVRGEVPSEAPVVFVNIDERTIGKIGEKPWDRLNFVQTLHGLLGPGQARAVGVDVIFSPLGTGSLLDVERAREGDRKFGDLVNYYSDKLVLAAAYTGTSMDIGVLPMRRHGFDDPAQVPFPEAPTYPIIQSDQARLGLVNLDIVLNDGQVPHKVLAVVECRGEAFGRHLIKGQIRSINHVVKDPEVQTNDGYHKIVDPEGFIDLEPIPVESFHRFLTLGLEVFLAAHGLNASAVEWTDQSLIIRKDGKVFREVPLIDGQTMDVNWLQGWDVKRPGAHYSMAEVLEQANALGDAAARGDAVTVAELEQWFERFKGKVVFIGGVDATLKDLAPTPYDKAPVPKVGVHANLYQMLEQEAYLAETGPLGSYVITLSLSALVATLLLCGDRRRSLTRMGAALVLVVYVGLVFYSFAQAGYVVPLIAPVGASVSAALFVILCKLGFEEYQRRRIKNLFGSYVSPSLVEEMVESERDPELGGIEVQVTALFSDVEGFSALSEKLSPNDLVALMNEYLGAMTETFQEEQGTLDKYIGDAIVTMFGMPYPVEDHAARACRSALRMQERHAELRELWAKEQKWPEEVLNMRTRIGINTGEAVIGNMGSKMRFNYTMMGDSVNLAARCESGAKSYGVYTMITADTLEAANSHGESLSSRKLDRIIVKGRSQLVEIYELWDGTIDPAKAKACKQAYEAALELYFSGDWENALAGFESSLANEPGQAYAPTTPSEVLATRCREFLESGTPENWDGVYRMTSK